MASLNATALKLSLEYNFVTELTSLVVVADSNFTVDDNGENQQENEFGSIGSPIPTNDINCKCKNNDTIYNVM